MKNFEESPDRKRKLTQELSKNSKTLPLNSQNFWRADSRSKIVGQSVYNLPKKTVNYYRTIFDSFDSTKGDCLLPADLRNMFSSIGINMERSEIFQILCDYDESEKGFIDFNDFMKVMTDKVSFYKLPDLPKEKQIFKNLAINGELTEDSLEKAYSKFGFVTSKNEVKEIHSMLIGYFGEENDGKKIDLPLFQRLMMGTHQELGAKLKDELSKL